MRIRQIRRDSSFGDVVECLLAIEIHNLQKLGCLRRSGGSSIFHAPDNPNFSFFETTCIDCRRWKSYSVFNQTFFISRHQGQPQKGGAMYSAIQTEDAPAAIGPYSQAMVVGDWVFVSGQIGLDPASGVLKGPDLEAQARQALANLKAILKAADRGLSQVAAVDVYLADMKDFAAFNAIYEEFFGSHRPARAVVAVKELPKQAVVEIKCIAGH
jgi:2-iminobutanoate/2-iminopropanoate deaminase